MNRRLSVFHLFLRHSGGKILLLLALSAAIQGAVFTGLLKGWGTMDSFEATLEGYGLPLVTAVVFIILTALLVRAGAGKGTHAAAYTLDRLRVSPKEVLLCQILYNVLALLLFWVAQVATIALLWKLFLLQGGQSHPQTLFLAVWRNQWLHTFLPVGDGRGLAVTLSLLLGLGVVSACESAELRKSGTKTRPFLSILLAAILILATMKDLMGWWMLLVLLSVGVAGGILFSALSQRKGGEQA